MLQFLSAVLKIIYVKRRLPRCLFGNYTVAGSRLDIAALVKYIFCSNCTRHQPIKNQNYAKLQGKSQLCQTSK
jgi:hypothetical protein